MRAQAPPPSRDNAAARTGTGSIRGRVVAVETGAPLRRAQILLNGTVAGGIFTPLVLTDAEGRYQFNEVAPGRYTLAAAKSGYVSLSYGQRRPGEAGRTVEVINAQTISAVDFALPKGAVIVVRVLDAFGAPMPRVFLQASQYRYANGERQLSSVAGSAETDDSGQARLHGLLPGEYYVGTGGPGFVLTPADSVRSYITTYYPGTALVSEAQRVTVGIGQEVSVAFPMVAARLSRITGVVRSPTGTPFSQLRVSLTQSYMGGFSSRGLSVQPDGSFSLSNLSPGEYAITVAPNTQDPAAPQEYARLPIVLSGQDSTGLVVTTGTGGQLRGRFVFDTGAPPSGLQPAGVPLQPTFVRSGLGTYGRSVTNPDWTFELNGLFGAPVLRLGRQSNGWYLKSVVVDGRDVTDTPLDFEGNREIKDVQVVLTQKQTELSGGATDDQSAVVNDYAAVVFAEDRAQWTPLGRSIAAGRPDQQGRFKIVGLPPGRYLAAAVDYLPTGSERDPELLARLVEQAARFTLAEGETRTLNLRLMP